MSTVKVVPHDPAWRTKFEAEARRVNAALGENVVAIHHIGSTSIPGIYAKPVIDMLVEVDDIAEVDARGVEMETIGYEVMGEFGIRGRRYFRKDNDERIRTHQIHVFETGSPQIERHLAFRDYMIAHPHHAQEYSALKHTLADKHADSADAYMDAKDGFIKEMDRRAARWRASRTGS